MKPMRLGDLVKIRTGKLDANAATPDGEYPFFTCAKETSNIDTYSYDCECVLVAGNGDLNVKYYSGKFDAYQRTYIIKSFDSKVLSTKYLFYYLGKYVEQLRNESIGGVIKYIKLGNLTEAQIPLVSLNAQMQIVERFSNLEAMISKRKIELSELDNLVKSRFIEMFGNGQYPSFTLGTHLKTTSGGTPSKKHPEYYENGTIPWLTSGEVNKGRISVPEHYITKAGLENSSAKLTPAGSVVVAMYGATAGQVGIVDFETATNQAVCCIAPTETCNSEYLRFALESQKDWMISQCLGGAQPNISQGVVRRAHIPDAPIAEQSEFAAFVSQVDKSKFAIRKMLGYYLKRHYADGVTLNLRTITSEF